MSEITEKEAYILDAVADDADRLSRACAEVLASDHPGSRTRLTMAVRELDTSLKILRQIAA